MRGTHTSLIRRTKLNAVTLGVSLVVLGSPWGPLWPWVCDMPILDLEVGEVKWVRWVRIKTVLHEDIVMEGHILVL